MYPSGVKGSYGRTTRDVHKRDEKDALQEKHVVVDLLVTDVDAFVCRAQGDELDSKRAAMRCAQFLEA